MPKVIEGLLPVDPVGALKKIKDNYLRYFETAFKFEERFPGDDLDQRKNVEMRRGNNLFHEYPYCEIIPEYVSDGKHLPHLIQELPPEQKAMIPEGFADFISLGLMNYPPYQHQFESLVSAFVEGKNTVITSGTGSGKTESFMLPLLASLFKEMTGWPKQSYNLSWYQPVDDSGQLKGGYDQAYQRANETTDRPSSLRALIMYPMNALVEDQIARLRKAIDGDKVRAFFDEKCEQNRIFFGQYNSSTIGHKSLKGIAVASNEEQKRCLEELTSYASNYKLLLEREEQLINSIEEWESELKGGGLTPARVSELQEFIVKEKKELDKIKEAKYIAPRLTPDSFSGEMVTRWDMQDKAPDILITNFSMLSAMMMRSSERKMFNDSYRWYNVETDMDYGLTAVEKEAEKKKRVFHLILDELHLYRGTAGTEVAYLIRTFLNEIGVPPVVKNENGRYVPNKQLRIIASSASLDDPQDFLKQFFGVYDEMDPDRELFNIIRGSDYIPEDRGLELDYNLFRVFAQKDEMEGMKYIDDPLSRESIKQQFIHALNDPDVGTLTDFVKKYREKIFYDFKNVCKIDSPSDPTGSRFVPKALSDYSKNLFGGDDDALRGFFIFRADEEVIREQLPRFRFHQFFKYVEGLWGELTENIQNNHQQVIGNLMYVPQEIVKKDQTQHRVLELLRCECCGALFIGGNRRTIDPDNYYLTLNYPELGRIPNRNPTPMVQNKRFPAYAIFWPHEEDLEFEEFSPIRSDGVYSYTETGFRGRWKRAFLNPFDGKMELFVKGNQKDYSKWIKGYTYALTPDGNNGDENKIMALPCTCPHCDKDYRARIYTKSPIRSFRSGIARSNQMICKELFYQLPSDNKKLIGFSDSRQDAAEQAANIAVEHYRDMVRLSFMECVSERPQDTLESLKGTVISLIQSGVNNTLIQSIISQCGDVDDNQKRWLGYYAQNRDIASINNLHNDDQIIPLSDLISSGNQILGGRLVGKLLRLGMNPAGPEYADQTINDFHWSCAYDFQKCQAGSNMDAVIATRIRNKLSAAIFHNSFGEYFRLSTEDVGLGYLGIRHFQEKHPSYLALSSCLNSAGINVKAFLNAYVRVLGDNYRYADPDSKENNRWDSYRRYTSRCKKHIETITAQLNHMGNPITSTQFGDLVHNTLVACGITDVELTLGSLAFYRIAEDDRYYECPKCHRVHLHWGMGLCTNTACCCPLDSNKGGFVREIHQENFVAYDLMRERRNACRIHTEELSGQTDDQASRLLEFKGIILDDPDHSISREIDMINVTTTMEVGVDIGGLLAVFQGNMPPTRYNYQQRVGRGGRRGQPFSTAITFCRGKSHDTYYYTEAVDEMLGGIPSQPKLAIRPVIIGGEMLFNDEIVRRVILKQVLHLAMMEYVRSENDIDPFDVVGEFGLVRDWDHRIKPHLIHWINASYNDIADIVHYYLDQYYGHELVPKINDIIHWFTGTEADAFDASQSACIRSIDAAIKVANCQGLGQCLTEAGLLPLYGMPSNSRVLYHGKKGKEYREIDRPVEQAITEFAPGSVKTKDHGYYTAAGVTTNFKMKPYETDDDGVIVDDARWDVFEFCHRMSKDQATGKIRSINRQTEEISVIEQDGSVPIIIPKAFRTNRIAYNYGRKSQNNDRGSFSQASIWADASNIQNLRKEDLPNATVRYWTCGGDQKPTVWYINDNNGKLYTGNRFFITEEKRIRGGRTIKLINDDSPKHIRGSVDNCLTNINVFPSFLVDEQPLLANGQESHFELSNGKPVSHSIALGAKKVTEMICISIRHINPNLNLCVEGQFPGYEPGIIAAYYSAATLIQRAFADELDIQPDEIEISEIKIEDGYPCIYLSDALANGSGYVGMLMERVASGKTRLQELLERIVRFDGSYLTAILSHRDQCSTSCPKCLRTYQNAGYHHVLDWRLGVDLIKLMLDDSYDMGYTDLDCTPYGDLREQMRIAGEIVTRNNTLIALKTEPNGHYYLSTIRRIPPVVETKEAIVHPLWNHNPMASQNFFELLRTGYKQKSDAPRVPYNNALVSGNNTVFHF